MSDPRAVLAREAHRLAGQSSAQAEQYRERRNRLVRELRAADPRRWTYTALARAVGITPELAAAIVKGRTGSDALQSPTRRVDSTP